MGHHQLSVGASGTVTSMVFFPWSDAWAMILATSWYLTVRSVTVPMTTVRPELRARSTVVSGGTGMESTWAETAKGRVRHTCSPGPAAAGSVVPTPAGTTDPLAVDRSEERRVGKE